MPTYYARSEGWILGKNRVVNEPVLATYEEAKYALLNGTLATTTTDGTTPIDGGTVFVVSSTDTVLVMRNGAEHEILMSDFAAAVARIGGLTSGGGTGGGSTPTPTPVDTIAPVITSPLSVSIAENQDLLINLTASEPVTWSKVGGADAALFALDSVAQTLLLTARDFEAANHGPTYAVQIRATDAAGNAATQTVTVTVTNVLEGTRATIAPASAVMPFDTANATRIFDLPGLVEGESRSLDKSWLTIDGNGDVIRNAMTGPASSTTAQTIVVNLTSTRAGEPTVATALTITVPAVASPGANPTPGVGIFGTVKPTSVNIFADLVTTQDQAEVIDTSIWTRQSSDAALSFVNGKAVTSGAQTAARYFGETLPLKPTGRRLTGNTRISATSGNVSVGSSGATSGITGQKSAPGNYMSNYYVTDGTVAASARATFAAGVVGEVESIHVFDMDAMLAKPWAIYLVVSQSNFVGNAAVADQALDTPAFGCLAIPGGGNASRGWEVDADGIGKPGLCVDPIMHTLLNTGGGPGGATMREVRKNFAESITPVLIATGANGAGFGGNGLWNKNASNPQAYVNAWKQWRAAWAAAPAGSFIAGIIFCQGEADIGSSQRLEHQTRVRALFDEIHAEPGWTAPKGSTVSFGRIPIVIAEIGYNLDPAVQDAANITNVNAMIEMQKKWATGSGDALALERCEYVPRPTDATFMPDNVHYDQRTYRNIGANVGKAIGRLTYPLA